jgi:FlaA1/EpsC-like NDP-sugar epimerase
MLRDVLSRCAGLKVQIKILPVSFVDVRDRGAAGMLQDVSPEDLLPRALVSLGDRERTAIAGRRVLVTGAAGSIGSEICRQLLDGGVGELLAVDINENRLYFLEQRLRARYPAARLVAQLADVRDVGRVDSLFAKFRPKDVFHAAAHKQVPIVEAAPCEAIKNNVGGARHVLQAADRFGAECVVFISSDKAVAPTSVMGATKHVGELMTRSLAGQSSARYRAVRFGNVFGSDGSVVPVFKEQIAKGGPVTITHPDVRRYFMSIDEAVGLVLRAAYGEYGELCVLDMGEPIRILDLARQMITLAGLVPDVDIPIAFTGLRQGEKLNEDLIADDETVVANSDGRIQVVTAPPPAADLWARIEDIEAAAKAEDTDRVLCLLRSLTPLRQAPMLEPRLDRRQSA